jgi:hypothetical protein
VLWWRRICIRRICLGIGLLRDSIHEKTCPDMSALARKKTPAAVLHAIDPRFAAGPAARSAGALRSGGIGASGPRSAVPRPDAGAARCGQDYRQPSSPPPRAPAAIFRGKPPRGRPAGGRFRVRDAFSVCPKAVWPFLQLGDATFGGAYKAMIDVARVRVLPDDSPSAASIPKPFFPTAICLTLQALSTLSVWGSPPHEPEMIWTTQEYRQLEPSAES